MTHAADIINAHASIDSLGGYPEHHQASALDRVMRDMATAGQPAAKASAEPNIEVVPAEQARSALLAFGEVQRLDLHEALHDEHRGERPFHSHLGDDEYDSNGQA